MTEEVTVSSRVTEVQSTSGERSFTLESEALKNIANNGRALFNFATLVPGALSQNTGGAELGSGQRLHRERPATELQQHHDRRRGQHRHRRQRRQHGHDEHRRRRRVQDPHQRVPGGVRPRRRRPAAGGHQERHAGVPRLGLLVRTPLGLERQHVAEQAGDAGDRAGQDVAQRLRLHDRRPGLLPRFQHGQEEAVLLLESGISASHRPGDGASGAGAHGARAAGDFSQSVDSSGNPFPYIRDFTTGLPCSCGRHSGCFRDGGVLGRIPASRLYAPGHRRAEHLPDRELLGRQRPERHEPGSRQLAAPRRSAPDGLPGDEQLAHHRPLHEEQGRHPASLRDDLGGQRQRPASDAGAVRAPGLELHALGDRRPEQYDVPRAQLGTRGQFTELQAAAGQAVPGERRVSRRCRCCSRTRCRRTTSRFSGSAAVARATPGNTRPTAGRSPTRTSPTTSSRT